MKTALKIVVACGVFAAVITAAYFMLAQRSVDSGRPVRLDLSGLKQTDPALVVRAELQVFKPQISNLMALAVGRDDAIYVGSLSGDVEILDADGVRVADFAVGRPVRCLAVAPEGAILAGVEDHVEVFSGDGRREAVWPSPDEKTALTSLAVSSNFVFAADYVNRIVWRFDRSGGLSGRIGDRDNGRRRAGFVVPSPFFDLAVAPDGSLWAANPGEHRLEHFTAAGEFLSAWGRAGLAADEFCGCCNPSHFAIMPDGMFVTSEKRIVRVKLYDRTGVFKGVLCGQEAWSPETTGLDLAADSRGRILVLDPPANAIRVYSNCALD